MSRADQEDEATREIGRWQGSLSVSDGRGRGGHMRVSRAVVLARGGRRTWRSEVAGRREEGRMGDGKRYRKLAAASGAHEGIAWCVSWSPSGELLASCGEDRTVKVFALVSRGKEDDSLGAGGDGEQEGEEEAGEGARWSLVLVAKTEETFERTLRSVTWSPDGRTIAVAGFDATAIILSLKGTKLVPVETLELHESEVKSVCYAPSGALLATCSRDKNVYVWECGLDTDFECIAILYGHQQDVKCVRFHPTQELLASASYDNTIRLWREDNEDWYCCGKLSGHTSTVWAISFSDEGDRLASVSADRSLIVWKQGDPPPVANGSDPVWKVQWRESEAELHHTRPIYSVDWSGARVVTGCGDDAIRIFYEPGRDGNGDEDRDDGDDEHRFVLEETLTDAHRGDVNCVMWRPGHPDTFASSGDDGDVVVWKRRSE